MSMTVYGYIIIQISNRNHYRKLESLTRVYMANKCVRVCAINIFRKVNETGKFPLVISITIRMLKCCVFCCCFLHTHFNDTNVSGKATACQLN